jgi:molybdopterin molybdotransferase
MISVQEALSILQNNLPQPKLENVILDMAFGCYLGEDISAPEPSPRYTNSAMDGFAIRWADWAGADPVAGLRLKVIGESQAGIPFQGSLSPGTGVRISTGAMLPAGADTVVRVEDTREEEGGHVTILEARVLGQDVRREGEEFQKGELLFHKGDYLGARELALLAAVGMKTVPVYKPPRVSLLVTGTELAPHDTDEILPHQIRDSNSIMLASAVRETGAELHAVNKVKDSLEHTVEAVKEALNSRARIIICSGGVSVGRHDHVKEAALSAGFTELFWKIRQKPGKPLFVSRHGDTLLFGLPGNPVSAYMCFTNYVRPVLTSLRGTSSKTQSLTARTVEKVSNNGKRTNFVRVRVEDKPNQIATIQEVAQQGSHMLSSIVKADGYIVLEPGAVLEPGMLVDVVLFP